MSDKRCTRNKRISNNKAKKLLDKQLGICPLCGKAVDINKPREKHWNVDHIIPKSINKWIEFNPSDSIDFNVLLSIIDSDDNIIITHYNCNCKKGALVISNKDVDKLHISKEHKQRIIKLIHKAKPFINYYDNMKRNIHSRQKCKCYMCGSNSSMHRLNLRRLDRNKNRTMKNAILICRKCEILRYKIRVLER